MPRSRILFWSGEPSPHQSAFLTALADLLPPGRMIGVFQGGLPTERLALGWRTPDLGRVRLVISPAENAIEELVLQDPENSVHIFDGLRLPMVNHALRICTPTKALIGIHSEARDWHGWRGKLRVLHSYFVERPYRNRVNFVLAVGHSGIRWYEKCGYPHHRIFPWGYVVEKASNKTGTQGLGSSGNVVITYVGRCIPGKGIETLLKALATLPLRGWALQIVGDGPRRTFLERLVGRLGLTNRVRFLGIKKNSEVRRILEQTDLLAFPSCIDGWGAVVNEALMSGVPVVCSDYCGAADLVCASGFGETFRARSTDDLARVLNRWIRKGRLNQSLRREIRAWSHCIEGEAVAGYLIEVIKHIDGGAEKPVAPWLSQHRQGTPFAKIAIE